MRPGLAQLHLVLGKAFLAEKNASRAFEELKVGAGIDKLNPEFLEPTADACLMLGSPNYVAYGYTKAKQAAKVTRTTHAVLTYVKAALEMGKIPEAKEQLSTYLSERGSSAEGLYLMYWCEKLDHNEDAAKKWEKLAKTKDPDIAGKVEVKPVDLSEMRAEMRRVREEQGLSTPEDKTVKGNNTATSATKPTATGTPVSSTPVTKTPPANAPATLPESNVPASNVPAASAPKADLTKMNVPENAAPTSNR
jgi:hypothetical protein